MAAKQKTGAGNGAETGAYMEERIKKRMVELLLTFCMVTTGSVFVCAVYNKIFWPYDSFMNGDILWQLLALALLCSVGNFLHPYKEISRRRALIEKVLHYLYINIVVLCCGFFCGLETAHKGVREPEPKAQGIPAGREKIKGRYINAPP